MNTVLTRIERMTPAQIELWLVKTSKSIRNCEGSRNMSKNQRLLFLCSRYNMLKSKALELKSWEKYCDNQGGLDLDHNGFDVAA